MTVRLLLGALLLVCAPALAEAADCMAVRQDHVSLVEGADCVGIELKQRKPDDPQANVDVAATWIEFVQPAGPGEWRYNDWIREQLAELNLGKPLTPTPGQRREDRFTVRSFYRSDRLISARYGRWVRAAGAKTGATIYSSINVALTHWTLLTPDDLVSLGGAANACWRQFGADERHGEAFTRAYPRERPWVDRDFEIRRIGPYMRDMIGPVLINPKVSTERTQRIFVGTLQDQSRWSFSEHGALVDFGGLLGVESGLFTCSFSHADLQAIAHDGVALPP
jgi:hypothetical protein